MPHRDAYGNAYHDTNAYGNTDPHGNSNAHGNGYPYCYTESNTKTTSHPASSSYSALITVCHTVRSPFS